jgi:hypothetical protein
LIDITGIRARVSEDRMLAAIFEQLDRGQTPRPFEDRADLGSWSEYEVNAEAARSEVVQALVGGREIGQLLDTMNAELADQTWQHFTALFAADRRYYTGLALGDPACAFRRGAAIVDATRAGFLGVVESD